MFKTQLPVPFNIVYNGTICCVHNGIISEDELDEYKKKELPHIFEKIKQMADGKLNDVSAEKALWRVKRWMKNTLKN